MMQLFLLDMRNNKIRYSILILLCFLHYIVVAQTSWSGTQPGYVCNNGTVNIKLSADTRLTDIIKITGGTVNLDLNGFVLDRGQEGRVIEISGGVLNITDSQPTVSHKGVIAKMTTGGTYEYPYWKRDDNGDIEIKGGIITGGKTFRTSDDGACISVTGTGSVVMNGGNLAGNVSYFNGGAVYMYGNTSFTMNGGSICYNAGVSGGGVIVFQNSTFTMNGGEVSYNHACDWGSHNGGNGGGIFSGGSKEQIAITTINSGSFIGNYAAKSGGALLLSCPFYDGTNLGTNPTDAQIRLKMGSTGPVLIKENQAKWGGGINLDGCTSLCLLNGNVTIEGNVAEQDGGGIRCGAYQYSELPVGMSEFPYKIIRLRIYGGKIINNKAGEGYNGGGIFDNSEYNGLPNRFSTYIDIGSTNALVVKGNTAGDEPNDIYLTNGRSLTALASDINPQDVGVYTGNTNDEPAFLYSGDGATILDPIYSVLVSGTKNIFHNNPVYQLKPYSSGSGLFFTKLVSPWSMEQQATTTSDLHLNNGYYEISSVKELTAFLWHVNGITTHGAFGGGDLGANGKLMADINMSGHYWLPIEEGYSGIFDGNGYTISNLTMERTNPSTERGMFGRLDTGTEVKNLQLHGCSFISGGAMYVGCIASRMNGGTVHDCVVDGTLTSSSSPVVFGGLVGKLTGGTIHSSFASPTMTGYQMGGLVGETGSGTSLKNSFANAKFTQNGTGYVGGLVGVNAGTVENCYVREQAGSSHGSSFGWCVGDNSGTIAYCYIPAGETGYKAHGTDQANTCTTYGTTQTPYLYKHADNQMAANANNSHIENGIMGNDRELKGLLATLNNWVDANSGFTPWMRTCASPINGDYPLLKQPNACCVGSPDNINLEYNTDFNTLFDNYVASNNGSGGGTVYLYKTPAVITSGTQENVNVSNRDKATKLYIGESVALKPASGTGDINAYVGITLDNSAGSEGSNPTWGGSDAIDWHMFATPLAAAPLGVNYVKDDLTTTDDTQYAFSWEHPTSMPYYRFYPEGDANHGYFPSMEYGWAASHSFTYNGANTIANDNGNWYNDWDYYCYYEPDAHWINFKRNGQSHWVEPENPDHTHPHIDYQATPSATANVNEATLVRGKGYLVATAEPTYLQCSGTLNVGDVSLRLTANGYYRTGYNLLGNPYQSYLDFKLFAESNSGDGKIWAGAADAYYFILDEDQGGYTKYAYDASVNTYTAPRCLHPHQGFMVVAQGAATAAFTEDMRITTATAVTFRDAATIQPAYPLVNLIATDDSGNRDVCTIELDRPDHGGAGILRELRICKGLVYCHYDDTDYSIAFTRPGLTEAAIRFETIEDSEFTFTWDTQNGDFHYLHLIDNMTGTDIDCLASNEYKFTSRTSDYASRFRLVFDYTGIDEPEVPEPVEGPTSFAFVIGDQMVVNGEGTLQIIDMQGRIIETATLVGPQNTLPVPTTAGLYVLRLNSENGTRTQKIVIR